jgi:hypothetical protein
MLGRNHRGGYLFPIHALRGGHNSHQTGQPSYIQFMRTGWTTCGSSHSTAPEAIKLRILSLMRSEHFGFPPTAKPLACCVLTLNPTPLSCGIPVPRRSDTGWTVPPHLNNPSWYGRYAGPRHCQSWEHTHHCATVIGRGSMQSGHHWPFSRTRTTRGHPNDDEHLRRHSHRRNVSCWWEGNTPRA